MDAIAKQVNNPEWWFTVVVVGLIVGVVAAYAKDWLTAVLSSLSSKYRIYAEVRSKTRSTEVKALAANPQLLLIEYIHCLLILAATVAMLASSYLLTAWNVLRVHFPDVDPVTKIMGLDRVQGWLGLSIAPETQNLLTQLIFGIPGLLLWNHFLNRYFQCQKARKLLRGE